MPSQIRSLVSSALCLAALACSPSTPSRTTESPPKGVGILAAPARAPSSDTLLAATAPLPPRSVVAAATKHEPPAAKEPLGAIADGGEQLAQARAHREPEDYARPLSAAEVKVMRFVLASGVVGREPRGESDSFAQGTKIFAFVELANEAAPYAFRVHWEPSAGPLSPYGVELHVESAARFRTWAYTAIPRAPGEYRAVLRTLTGEEIASRTFSIVDESL